MEQVIQLTCGGRVFTIRAESVPPFEFWRVDTAGWPTYHSQLRALGDEQPAFFLGLAELAKRAVGPVDDH